MNDFEAKTIMLIERLTKMVNLQPTLNELCSAYFEFYGEACPRYKLAECLANLENAGLVGRQGAKWAVSTTNINKKRVPTKACVLPRHLPVLR